MNLVSKIVLSSGFILSSLALQAQTNDPVVKDNKIVNKNWTPSLTTDGVIDRVDHVQRVAETPRIREIDVAWKRRVWRLIDVRQKVNQAFIYQGDEFSGGGAFIEILLHLAQNKDIAVYNNDEFKAALGGQELEDLTRGKADTVTTVDPYTGEEVQVITRTEFNPQSIIKYRVKEDWIMDRNRGKMIVEIIGIAPLQIVVNPETGLPIGESPMFWIYYPDARKYLAQYEVYNPRNDMQRISWADYLDARYFDSYVYKTSAYNAHGLEMPKGLRGLQEGERAMDEIYNKSMEMWEN